MISTRKTRFQEAAQKMLKVDNLPKQDKKNSEGILGKTKMITTTHQRISHILKENIKQDIEILDTDESPFH